MEDSQNIDFDLSTDTNDDITTAEILNLMEEIWLNEKFAPEILPHRMDIIDALNVQIQEMEKNIRHLSRSDMRRFGHELELSRIRFLLTSYLRTRVLKIEIFADCIFKQEETRRNNEEELYLSDSESVFLASYKNITCKYITDILNLIPYTQDQEDIDKNAIKFNLNSFVFFQSKKDIEGVIVEDGNLQDDIIDIKYNSKMIMSYKSISNLVKNGDVKLI